MIDKQEIVDHFDMQAPQRLKWFYRNYLYHQQIIDICRPFINPESRILELGCSVGATLGELDPSFGVGVDISPASIAIASQQLPHMQWIVADVEDLPAHAALSEPFDIIIIEDLLPYLDNIQCFLESIKPLVHDGTRLIISTWNWLWEPILQIGEKLRLKSKDLNVRTNWVSLDAINNLLTLAGYKTLTVKPGILMPYDIPFITPLVNAFSYAPLTHRATLLSVIVAQPQQAAIPKSASVSVIIPTRNEAGNIRALIERTPDMGSHTELIFVDGNSTDGTVDEIHHWASQYSERDIKFIPQIASNEADVETPPDLMLKLGKGDAVRKGFDAATGDILMILDSDVSVLPEDLSKFYDALTMEKARFANGTRFIYPQQEGAMRPLNRLGNVFFSLVFSWLLSQRITDTLCGTKVLWKKDYEQIAANRNYFGDFDPFGDFDLLFGAAWLGHTIIDVPVRYQARKYGESKVRINQHGPLLIQMSLIALWHFKIRPLFSFTRRTETMSGTSREHGLRSYRSKILLIIVGVIVWLFFRRRSK